MAAADADRDYGDIRETLGWLKANVEHLIAGQKELRDDIRNINKRIDKLVWWLIGGGITIGGVVIGTLVTVIVRGGWLGQATALFGKAGH